MLNYFLTDSSREVEGPALRNLGNRIIFALVPIPAEAIKAFWKMRHLRIKLKLPLL